METGVGENTGPTHKDNHDKTEENFVDLLKVARAQHIQLHTLLTEKSGCNPLPPKLQEKLALTTIPFFHVIGMHIRFYILFQINGDLYGIWDWTSESLPTKDTDVDEALSLCKCFLLYKVCYFFLLLLEKSLTLY